MYQLDENVWVILNMFDIPKECTVVEIHHRDDDGTLKGYTVQYKHRFFKVYNEDVYPTQIDAEIFWAIIIQQEHYQALNHTKLFLTDDYERAFNLASKILSKYAEECPHILLKYL